MSYGYPPAKIRKLSTGPVLSGPNLTGSVQFAGEEHDGKFNEPKSLLNNALQANLRRIDEKLKYVSQRTPLPDGREISRCTLYVPYPEPFSVIGEGWKSKDAERRAAAVACCRLNDMGVLANSGNLANKLSEVEEDKQPRVIDLSLSHQTLLFNAVSTLPTCQSISNWDSVSCYYQKLPVNIGGTTIKQNRSLLLTLEPSSKEGKAHIQQSIPIHLPMGISKAESLGNVACPTCHSVLNVVIKEGTDVIRQSPLLPLPVGLSVGDDALQIAQINTPSSVHDPTSVIQCAFTGKPYVPPSTELCRERSCNLKKKQEAIESSYQTSSTDSPIYVARNLPIVPKRNEILAAVHSSQVVIIAGATGSGKTTQVPQYVLENYVTYGLGANCNIIVTQPRRISAISNAERVATERGEAVGTTIGYQVRMESCVPSEPGRVLFCTAGVLLAKLRSNPTLEGVSHVIVDEVHERDIITDFLLVFLADMVKNSFPVKIIVMSASVNTDLISGYFQTAGAKSVPCLSVQGRLFPVSSHYLNEILPLIGWRGVYSSDDPETNVDLVVAVIIHLVKTTTHGAILVFLPGWDDILAVLNIVEEKLKNYRCRILPLHSMLSASDQQRVFYRTPEGIRKVILSTNISETSVTIDDVVWVINAGNVKVKTFDSTRRMSSLSVKWCSKSSVVQRTGRAGRCQPGHCFNLFSKHQESLMADFDVPEMHRVPLEEIVLQTKAMKPDVKCREFLSKALSPPPLTAVSSAIGSLTDLGVLDEQEQLTVLGRMLALLPVEPSVARLIILGAVFKTLDPILTVAASLGYRHPFLSPPGKQKIADEARLRLADGCCSDHLLLIKAYNGWRESITNDVEAVYVRENFLHRGTLSMIHGIRSQFLTQLNHIGFGTDLNTFSCDDSMIRAVLTAGLYPSVVKVAKMMESGGIRGNQVKRRVRDGCQTLQDGRVFLHLASVNSDKLISSSWFVYYEKVRTSNIQVRDTTLIHPLHLLLFGGKNLVIVQTYEGQTVIHIDNVETLAFSMPSQFAHLLLCAREGIKFTLDNTLRKVTSTHEADGYDQEDNFLTGLSNFLAQTTVYHPLK